MSTEKTTEPSTTKIVISFIVPAYNEEAELPGTLRAIRSAADGYEHEIVLVNDGSTDATGAIGEEFGARVISIQRRQIAAARKQTLHAISPSDGAGDLLSQRGPYLQQGRRRLPGHVTHDRETRELQLRFE